MTSAFLYIPLGLQTAAFLRFIPLVASCVQWTAPPLHQVVAHVAPGVLSSILARVLVDQMSRLKAAKMKNRNVHKVTQVLY